MSYYPFTYSERPPNVANMRRRVRDAIRRQRAAVARELPRRPDIAEMVRTGANGCDAALWQVRSELLMYRAIWRAELAHARGEHLDKWAIWPPTRAA